MTKSQPVLRQETPNDRGCRRLGGRVFQGTRKIGDGLAVKVGNADKADVPVERTNDERRPLEALELYSVEGRLSAVETLISLRTQFETAPLAQNWTMHALAPGFPSFFLSREAQPLRQAFTKVRRAAFWRQLDRVFQSPLRTN